MNTDQEYEIDLLELCRALWKNALAIALVAVIFGAAVFGVTAFFITPTYEATASLYINNNKSLDFGSTSFEISAGELTTSNSLVPAYLYILRSRTTMEDIIAEANLNYTTDELQKMITAKAVDKVAAFEVTVTSESPSEAEMIANTIAKLLPDRFAEVMDGSAVRIVDYAIIPSHRASPSVLKNTVLGCLMGGFLCAAIVILRSLLDDRSKVMIQSADEIRTMYPDLRVLAVIPDMRTGEKKGGYYSSYYGPVNSKKKGKAKSMADTKKREQETAKTARAKGPNPRLTGKLCEHMTYAAREAFKRLRSSVVMAFPEEGGNHCKVIGITSAHPSEGKSTVAVNLAYSLAELGKSVILVDGDMRRPSLHDKLGVRLAPGLSELLTSEDQVGAVVLSYKSSEGSTSFNLISAGSIPENPAELLNSKRFDTLIKVLSSACDYIILDLPPVDAVVDAVTASKLTDGMIVVVRENNCPRYILDDCMEQLQYAKANILGFVVNGSVEDASKRYRYNQSYRYGYHYGK